MREALYFKKRLFSKAHGISCEFTPVFGTDNSIIFRHFFQNNKQIKSTKQMWDGIDLGLKKFKIKKIKTFKDLKGVFRNGDILNGRTEIFNKEMNRKIIMEYPIKTINMDRVGERW